MTKNSLIKFAASTLVLGTALAGTQSLAEAVPDLASAAKASDAAAAALARRDAVDAVRFAERAVAIAPTDAAYRATLGHAYLLAGRFQSAETSFKDALSLDASNGRAALSLALSQIALGRNGAALATLDTVEAPIAVADLGLARALAGDTDRAIAMLAVAARSPDADAKVRQNLALAFALAGKWSEARTVAAQDVSPDELDQRIVEWARFTRPTGSWDQVASLLGVTPAADAGQPAQLALDTAPAQPVRSAAIVPQPQPQARAEFRPVSLPITRAAAPLSDPAPVAIAPARLPAPAYAVPTKPRAASRAHAEALVLNVPAMAAAKPVTITAKRPLKADVPVAKPALPVRRVAMSRPATGKFVVQLGAFSNVKNVQAAWLKARGKLTRLSAYAPSRSTFAVANASLYRLSVGGFETRAAAVKLCEAVRVTGGTCFVRTVAGDAPTQMVARETPKPIRIVSR